MKPIDKPVMPEGFKCASTLCGLKKNGKDLSVFYSDVPATATGVFTKNLFPGVPVILGKEIIKKRTLRAIVANSKISNVGTGEQGIQNAKRMAKAVSKEFNVPEDEVIMSSTGVIAKQLKIDLIEKGINGLKEHLTDDPIVAVEGIITTDTYPKALSFRVDNALITIVGKGAGMIEPNMATMLVYIFTDAGIKKEVLDTLLNEAVDVSFNMLSIDTDTSTSDTCLIMANGLKGEVNTDHFSKALKFVCIEMAKKLAWDGEGATKLLTATVNGAKNNDESKIIAKSLINSPLIKTMAYGADPNVGRILMALGKCFNCQVVPNKIDAKINNVFVIKKGEKADYVESDLRKLLGSDIVSIEVNLNVGQGSSRAFGCDLTEGYIKENAAYYSS